jgi:hypothetical protein
MDIKDIIKGKDYLVTVVEVDVDRRSISLKGEIEGAIIWRYEGNSALRELPPPDPHALLKQTALEAAIQHQKVWHKFNKGKETISFSVVSSEAADNALGALIATEPPLTPLQELEAFVQHAVDKNEFISTCELLKMIKNISSQRNTTP